MGILAVLWIWLCARIVSRRDIRNLDNEYREWIRSVEMHGIVVMIIGAFCVMILVYLASEDWES